MSRPALAAPGRRADRDVYVGQLPAGTYQVTFVRH
jgi:hypothetical protein